MLRINWLSIQNWMPFIPFCLILSFVFAQDKLAQYDKRGWRARANLYTGPCCCGCATTHPTPLHQGRNTTPSPPNLHHHAYFFFINTQRKKPLALCTSASLCALEKTYLPSSETAFCTLHNYILALRSAILLLQNANTLLLNINSTLKNKVLPLYFCYW